jgi:hypothetical protein
MQRAWKQRNNVFDYGHKGAADQMRTSWEKLCQHVGSEYGQDIANELQNKTEVVIPEPTHSDDVMTRHQGRVQLAQNARNNIRATRTQQLALLEQALDDGDTGAAMEIAVLQNDMAQAAFEAQQPIPIGLTDEEKAQYSNAWRTYRERNSRLQKNRGQAFSLSGTSDSTLRWMWPTRSV